MSCTITQKPIKDFFKWNSLVSKRYCSFVKYSGCGTYDNADGLQERALPRHAIIWADLSIVSMWDENNLADRLHIMSQADDIVLARGEDRVRLGKAIQVVWYD